MNNYNNRNQRAKQYQHRTTQHINTKKKGAMRGEGGGGATFGRWVDESWPRLENIAAQKGRLAVCQHRRQGSLCPLEAGLATS